jgi:hypothetical protein
MTGKEFHKLCNETPVGTTLSFNTGKHQLRGRFVGCTTDGVIIEANDQSFIWPRQLIDCRRADYTPPSYS